MRILVTGAAGPAGRALVQQISRTRHEIVGADVAAIPDRDRSNCSATHQVPAAADPAYLPSLRRLVTLERIDLLIPTVQDELVQVAMAAPLLSCRTVVAGPHAVMTAHDKLLTAWTLAASGVAVPATLALQDLQPTGSGAQRGIPALAEELTTDLLVLKPRVSRGGRGVRLIERHRVQELVDDPAFQWCIVQEFAGGTDYAVQVYLAEHAEYADVIVLEKTALKQGRIGNAAAVRRVPAGEDVDVARLALAAVRAVGLHGPVDVDVRRMPDGRPVVLELNARFGANSEAAPELLATVLADHEVVRERGVA